MSPDPAPESFVVHSGGEIVYADEMFLTLIGAECREQLVGTGLTELVAPDCRDPLREQVERIEGGDAPALGLAVSLRTLAGQCREVIAVSSPIEWQGTDAVQTSVLVVAGEGPAAGNMVRDSAMREAPIGITISDPSKPDNPLIYVNDEFLDLTGYPREEVLGHNCRFLQGEDTRAEPVAEMRAAIDAERPVTVELRNYRKDGSLFWNRVTIVPVRSQSGAVSHYVGFQQDITRSKLYEQELTLFKEQAAVADHAMYITDREGTIEYVNPAFERITGYSASEAIGRTPRILKSGKQDESFYEELWETITSGEIWEAELTNKTKDGQLYEVEQTIVPIADDRGEITHFASIERDITEEMVRNQTLDVLNRVLRHNLRTAIGVIDGYAELLEGGLDAVDRRAAISAIRNQTASLATIEDKIATIRTLWDREGGSRSWDLSHLDTLARKYRDQYPEADISVSKDVGERVCLPDAELFELALDEAVENAVTHTEQGTPRVEIVATRTADPDLVEIAVRDNGPGIPESERRILDTGTETPLSHSSGIGLWIMEWVTTSLSGEFEIAPTDPHGTAVTFQLPDVARQDADGSGTGTG